MRADKEQLNLMLQQNGVEINRLKGELENATPQQARELENQISTLEEHRVENQRQVEQLNESLNLEQSNRATVDNEIESQKDRIKRALK